MGMTTRYQAEALNQAVVSTVSVGILQTPEEIVARAQAFKDFLDGKCGNDETASKDEDEPDTKIITLDDAAKAWMTHQNAIALDQFAESERIRLGWDGSSRNLAGNYILGIQEAARFLRGDRLYSDSPDDTKSQNTEQCICGTCGVTSTVQVNPATEDAAKVAAEIANEVIGAFSEKENPRARHF